jgi:hypothetical protein
VGIFIAARQYLIIGIGASTFPNNPFDDHTLAEQLEQATILMQGVAVVPETVNVDRGYRLKKEDRLSVRILLPDMKHLMTEEERMLCQQAPGH